MVTEQRTTDKASDAPDPEHPSKIDSPTKLNAPSWKQVIKSTMRAITADGITDLAATMTYYTVLSLFPALLALVSVIILIGRADTLVPALTQLLADVAPSEVASFFGTLFDQFLNTQGAGIALVVGIVTAIWTASNFMAAFTRAMNRIYQVEEGRPFIKLKALQLALTLAVIISVVLLLAAVVLSEPVVRWLGDLIGFGAGAVNIWRYARLPLILVVVITLLAVLYYAAPNVRQPKFRWISIGAIVAIAMAGLGSLAFGIYVGNFASYEATYGALGGIIVGLLWLWLINLALLVGAELDSEIERARQLQSGMNAEEDLQLPPRDDKQSIKKIEKDDELVEERRQLKQEALAKGAQPPSDAGDRSPEPDKPDHEDRHPGTDLANRLVGGAQDG